MGKPTTKTLKVRVRDKHAGVLRMMASHVNLVWNYANEATAKLWSDRRVWPTAYDVQRLVAGASPFVQVGDATIQEVVAVHAKSRRQHHTSKLRWRGRRSLGWVPFKSRAARWRNGQVHFNALAFKVWDSYGLSQYQFRAGSFVEDARGRWYFCVGVEVARRVRSASVNPSASTLVSRRSRLRARGRSATTRARCARPPRSSRRRSARSGPARRGSGSGAASAGASRRCTRSARTGERTICTSGPGRSSIAPARSMSGSGTSGPRKSSSASPYRMARRGRFARCWPTNASTHASRTRKRTRHTARKPARPAGPSRGPRVWKGLLSGDGTCGECNAEHDRDRNAAINIAALGHQGLSQ